MRNCALRTARAAVRCWLLAAWLRAIPTRNAAARGFVRRECGAAFGIRSAGAQKLPEARRQADGAGALSCIL